MPSDTFVRATEIFLQASELPDAERERFLQERCGGEREVRRLVEQLLAGHDRARGTANIAAGVTKVAHELLAGEKAGESIGQYLLARKLGEGGFGDVWLAERRSPFVQRVAIKVIKPGMDSRAIVARFEHERQSLAAMDHPNIARVIDGGTTAAGRPYFVMEYVDGGSITAFARRRNLSIRGLLELFLPVCEAVQHAHQKGIIHRDLKPLNILVEEIDGKAIPKVIDFGVSKALVAGSEAMTALTARGVMVGTPEYMSPEQAGGASDIDTRTDVYALGVVLYELLVGVPPFEGKGLRNKGHEEILRIIREVEPPRPSTRVMHADADEPRLQKDGTGEIARELRRELEWIPLKAIRKERERRYGSVELLAADIRRYLRGEPLEAGPESRAYVARKFVARHRLAVVATIAGVLALIALTTIATLQRARAEKLAESERQQRDEARAASETLAEMARGMAKNATGESRRLLKAAIEDSSKSLERRTERSPRAGAAISETVARVLMDMGEFQAAKASLLTAAELSERAGGRMETDAIVARASVAMIDYLATFFPSERDKLGVAARELLNIPIETDSARPPIWQTITTIASSIEDDPVLTGRLALHAERLMNAAAEPPDSIDRTMLHFVRAMAEPDASRKLGLMRQVVSDAESRTAGSNPTLLEMRSWLRMQLQSSGLREEALAFSEETVRRVRASPLPQVNTLADELKEQGAICLALGDCELAIRRSREALVVYKSIEMPCNEAGALSALDQVGGCLNVTQCYDEAVVVYDEAMETLSKCPGTSTDAQYYFPLNRAVALSHLGRFLEAIADMERAKEAATRWHEERRVPALREVEARLARLRKGGTL